MLINAWRTIMNGGGVFRGCYGRFPLVFCDLDRTLNRRSRPQQRRRCCFLQVDLTN